MKFIKPPAPHGTEMLVVINDTQLKRQCDQEALGAALAFLEHYKDKITHFVFNGDILDFEEQSMYDHTPDMRGQAYEEIMAGKWLLEYISNLLPKAEKVFIDGNHEQRWSNYIKNRSDGIEHWVRTPEEMFKFKELGWLHVGYGRGQYYQWHERIFWHGARAGAKSNIPKLELDDAGVSVTTAHINRNMMHESVDALGHYKSAHTHGGFSKNNLSFMKKANTGWSQGFGVYYYNTEVGESVFPIVMRHGHPEFLYDGKVFSGRGFTL